MSPDEYFRLQVIKYPSLFAKGNNEKDSKMKVFDQLFNVLGNGIKCKTTLDNEIGYKIKNKKIISDELYNRAIQPSFFSIRKNKEDPNGRPEFIECIEADFHLYPDILVWKKNKIHPFTPYPNFKKEYSILWEENIDISIYGQEWIDIAIWYYSNAKEFFNSDQAKLFYGYAGKDSSHFMEKSLPQLKHRLLQYENNSEIYDAYQINFEGHPSYDEDVIKFAIKIWERQKLKYFVFIDETIKMLKGD